MDSLSRVNHHKTTFEYSQRKQTILRCASRESNKNGQCLDDCTQFQFMKPSFHFSNKIVLIIRLIETSHFQSSASLDISGTVGRVC